VLMLCFGSVLPGMKARSGIKAPIGTFMKRLLSTSQTEQFWSCAAAMFATADPASPAIIHAPVSAIRRTRFLTLLPLYRLDVAPTQTPSLRSGRDRKRASIRLVLARPEHIAHFEQLLGGALAHALRLDQMLDLAVRGDLDHLRRCGLVKYQRLQILIVHLLH